MKDIKTKCFKNPRKKLWIGATRDITNVQSIFHHIESLDYADCPDYNLIHDNLVEIYNRYEMVVLPEISPRSQIEPATVVSLPQK